MAPPPLPADRTVPPLLAVEVAAARVEGICAADPALARHWRTAMAWAEAAASAGLEDIRLSEPAIIMRLTANRTSDTDARGAELAGRILGVMVRPPDLGRDPVAALRRIEGAAAPLGQPADPADRLDDAEIAALVAGAMALAETPVAAALRAAADYAHRSRRQSPMAERLVFMAVESEARRITRNGDRAAGGGDRDGDAPSALIHPARAFWTLAPAAALSAGGFRVWSPLGAAGAFLEAARRQLGRELGQLGHLRQELGRLDAVVSGGQGRSRIADLAAMIRDRPILTSAMVMERLGVTRRTALSLIAAMEDGGCLVDFTARKAARFWATPSLAARLRHDGRARASRRPPPAASLSGGAAPAPIAPTERSAGDPDRFQHLLDDLDAAMKGIDDWTRNTR